jgi:site-specific recombinase XerC
VPVTSLDAIALHLEWCHDRGLSPVTIQTRRQTLGRMEGRLPCLLLGASPDHIHAWATVRRRELSPASFRAEMAHPRAFFDWCIRRGLRRDDPTADVELPRTARRLPRPAHTDLVDEALALVTDPADRVVLLLAFDGGMRRAEIAGLEWTGVDLRARTARFVGKGDRERVVPLSEDTVAALTVLPHRRGRVIQRRDGAGAISPGAVAERVRRYLGDATLHQLRHSAGTRWTRAGGIRVAQELLGHASPTTTAGYSAVDPGDMAAVVDITSLRALRRPGPDHESVTTHANPRTRRDTSRRRSHPRPGQEGPDQEGRQPA